MRKKGKRTASGFKKGASGPIVALFALKHPESVRSLVLIEPYLLEMVVDKKSIRKAFSLEPALSFEEWRRRVRLVHKPYAGIDSYDSATDGMGRFINLHYIVKILPNRLLPLT